MKIRKNEYCHRNFMRQKTKLSKKSRKTQFTQNAGKSNIFLRMMYA